MHNFFHMNENSIILSQTVHLVHLRAKEKKRRGRELIEL